MLLLFGVIQAHQDVGILADPADDVLQVDKQIVGIHVGLLGDLGHTYRELTTRKINAYQSIRKYLTNLGQRNSEGLVQFFKIMILRHHSILFRDTDILPLLTHIMVRGVWCWW